MTTDAVPKSSEPVDIHSSRTPDVVYPPMNYKQAKNLAATQRRDGTNSDAYAVFDVAKSGWTVS